MAGCGHGIKKCNHLILIKIPCSRGGGLEVFIEYDVAFILFVASQHQIFQRGIKARIESLQFAGKM